MMTEDEVKKLLFEEIKQYNDCASSIFRTGIVGDLTILDLTKRVEKIKTYCEVLGLPFEATYQGQMVMVTSVGIYPQG